VHVILTYPVSSCPLGALPAPCYEYVVLLTPKGDFSPLYVVPREPPLPALSPMPADTLWAQLVRQIRSARARGDSINREGVDQYLKQASRGAFSTVCALRVALDSTAYGRVSIRFYDATGRSVFRRDSQGGIEQALSPGWTDRADEGHMYRRGWLWKGRLSAQALPIDDIQQGATIRARLEPACRSLQPPA
jgi:hypothetical protein